MRRQGEVATIFACERASVYLKAALPLRLATAIHRAAVTVVIVRFGFDFA
jgi:hypothetical protein